jgi:hypothetical protein
MGKYEWMMVTFVPDDAGVRAKMLQASSRAGLMKALGATNFKHDWFATHVVSRLPFFLRPLFQTKYLALNNDANAISASTKLTIEERPHAFRTHCSPEPLVVPTPTKCCRGCIGGSTGG